VVHAQGSPGNDLGKRVFDFRAADTISDWTNGGVARLCYVGTEFKTLNDFAQIPVSRGRPPGLSLEKKT
jgi:hypothetical protein